MTGGITAERSTLDGDIGRFYYYPRYNASYRIPQFVGFLDAIKLRAAYGQSGNLPPYGSKYTPLVPQEIDGSTEGVLNNNTLGSSIMKPETEQETELGFDATMFGSRAQFSFTVYERCSRTCCCRQVFRRPMATASCTRTAGSSRTKASSSRSP